MKILPVLGMQGSSTCIPDKTVHPENLPTDPTICSQTKPKKPNEQKTEPSLKKKWKVPGYLKPVILPLKVAKVVLFNLHNILIYGTLLGTAALFTPGAWKFVSSLTQNDLIGLAPRTSKSKGLNEKQYDSRFDNFVQNFTNFNLIPEAIRSARITYESLDLNKSSRILDSKDEIQELIRRLETAKNESRNKADIELYTNAIRQLNDTNIVSQLIWGINGPSPDTLLQNGEPNCQGMAVIRGLYQNPGSIQIAKSLITPTEYNLNPYDFFIDSEVRINGKNIPVSFSELTASMGPRGYTPSQSKDGSLATAIINLAMKKAMKDVTPNIMPSSSSILLTDRDYSPVGIMAFSDSELDNLLSKSPGTIISIASTFSWYDVKSGLEYRANNWITPETSDEKVAQFKGIVTKNAQEIKASSNPPGTAIPDELNTLVALAPKTDTKIFTPEIIVDKICPEGPRLKSDSPEPKSPTTLPVASTFPPSSPTPASAPINPTITERSADYVLTGHVYVVEKYDREKGILTIADSHNMRIKLNREEVRERLIAVIAPNDEINTFSSRSYPIYGLVLGTGFLYWYGKRKIKGLIFGPKKESKEV